MAGNRAIFERLRSSLRFVEDISITVEVPIDEILRAFFFRGALTAFSLHSRPYDFSIGSGENKDPLENTGRGDRLAIITYKQ